MLSNMRDLFTYWQVNNLGNSGIGDIESVESYIVPVTYLWAESILFIMRHCDIPEHRRETKAAFYMFPEGYKEIYT